MAARKDPFSRDCEKGSILFSRFIYFSLLITVWARRSSPSKTLLIFFSPPINVWVRPVEPVKNLTHTAYLVVTAYQCLCSRRRDGQNLIPRCLSTSHCSSMLLAASRARQRLDLINAFLLIAPVKNSLFTNVLRRSPNTSHSHSLPMFSDGHQSRENSLFINVLLGTPNTPHSHSLPMSCRVHQTHANSRFTNVLRRRPKRAPSPAALNVYQCYAGESKGNRVPPHSMFINVLLSGPGQSWSS